MQENTHFKQMGEQRAAQPSFLQHNRSIALQGWEGLCAHWRAGQGLPLLDVRHIQYLRPEDLVKKGNTVLTPEQQRMVYFSYVWKAIWGHIPEARRSPCPTREQYEEGSTRVVSRMRVGLPIEDIFEVVYLVPNDLCDSSGKPYTPRTQKRHFRALLAQACDAALATCSRPRKLGLRVPQEVNAPRLPGHPLTTTKRVDKEGNSSPSTYIPSSYDKTCKDEEETVSDPTRPMQGSPDET